MKPFMAAAHADGRRRSRSFLILILAASLLAAASPAQEPAPPAAAGEDPAPSAVCPFCLESFSGNDFCPRCGRFAPAAAAADQRFWGDIPYVLAFPPQENSPEIQSEITDKGLVRESVRYASGDRYDLEVRKSGTVIKGKVGWLTGGKETEYTAEMVDGWDASRRLVTREITGKLSARPDMYLYRKLEYRYREDGRLEGIKFFTSFYRDDSAWKKSPASWLRHSRGEISFARDEQGALVRIETALQEGKRSLRGEPEYAAPTQRVDGVTRKEGQATGVSRKQP
jgi:hypothetical protein